MIMKPLLSSVWMYYDPAAEAVAEQSQRLFQRVFSDEEYLGLVDARTGEVVRVNPYQSPKNGFLAIRVNLKRTIQVNRWTGQVNVEYGLSNDKGGPKLTLMIFEVPKEAQKKGLATQMFAAQVRAARSLGFDHIFGYAKGRETEQLDMNSPLVQRLIKSGNSFTVTTKDWNGYYTWPSLGFDKEFTSEEQARLPVEFAHLSHLSDLMEIPEGRAWWKDQHGQGFGLYMHFDTSLQSRSMRTLDAALKRLDEKGEYWDSGPEAEFRIERGEHLRVRRDWQERVWQYRGVQRNQI